MTRSPIIVFINVQLKKEKLENVVHIILAETLLTNQIKCYKFIGKLEGEEVKPKSGEL